MDRGMKAVIVLLILSILVNLYTVNRLKKTENEVKAMRNNINTIYTNLDNSIVGVNNYIDNKLDEFTKENSWIVNEEFIIDYKNTTSEEVHLDIQWSFNELEKNAHVYVVYGDEKGNYKKEEATESDNGVFTASLILSPENNYKYKIMSEGSTVRVGEEKEVPEDYYKPGTISITGASYEESNGYLQDFEIEVTQQGSLISVFYKPEKLQLIINYRNNERETSEFQLISESLFTNIWSAKIESFKDKPESIILEIIYENGYIDSNEVWPEDKFSERLKYN